MSVPADAHSEPPSTRALFAGFFIAGLCGFGGVLPWARRMIVEQRKWLTPAEFAEMLGLCQLLAGRQRDEPHCGTRLPLSAACLARWRAWSG